MVAAVLTFGLANTALGVWTAITLPDLDTLLSTRNGPPEVGVRLADVPPYLIDALIATEIESSTTTPASTPSH